MGLSKTDCGTFSENFLENFPRPQHCRCVTSLLALCNSLTVIQFLLCRCSGNPPDSHRLFLPQTTASDERLPQKRANRNSSRACRSLLQLLKSVWYFTQFFVQFYSNHAAELLNLFQLRAKNKIKCSFSFALLSIFRHFANKLAKWPIFQAELR